MDYKDLIERLRSPNLLEPKETLLNNAAIAIETLVKQLDYARGERDTVTKRVIELEKLKCELDSANREIEQLTKANFWLSNDASMGIYDKRDVYRDCTVEVLQNSVTGSVSVGWWPNDCPPAGW